MSLQILCHFINDKKQDLEISHLTKVTQLIWWELRIILSSSDVIYSFRYTME